MSIHWNVGFQWISSAYSHQQANQWWVNSLLIIRLHCVSDKQQKAKLYYKNMGETKDNRITTVLIAGILYKRNSVLFDLDKMYQFHTMYWIISQEKLLLSPAFVRKWNKMIIICGWTLFPLFYSHYDSHRKSCTYIPHEKQPMPSETFSIFVALGGHRMFTSLSEMLNEASLVLLSKIICIHRMIGITAYFPRKWPLLFIVFKVLAFYCSPTTSLRRF